MRYVLSVSVIVSALMLVSCSGDVVEEEKLVRPIKYEKVTYLDNTNARTFSGISKTERVTQLSFRSTGVLSTFNISLGQVVKKGQLLASLDNVQALLNYENAVASKNSADSQMKTTKLNFDRVRVLYEKGASSLSDFESAKNSYRTAQESYNSSVRSIAIQQDQINYGNLYAPEDGVISAVNVEMNENIGIGQAIASLNSGAGMEISLGLPESVINGVQQGMKVKVDFTSLAGSEFDASVSEVSPSLDGDTATYPIIVVLDGPTELVKSGMSANITFNFEGQTTNSVKQRLIVPTEAVGEDDKGRFVFKIKAQGDHTIVEKVKIEIGSLTAQGFEVSAGLQRGDKVAVAGLQTLLNGQEVKLQ
ncbi:MAG: multidrug efflux system membrane fusion protein [Cellvibrionaceae bacterium]|jgi:multidrug efflux system membrane fusion protein